MQLRAAYSVLKYSSLYEAGIINSHIKLINNLIIFDANKHLLYPPFSRKPVKKKFLIVEQRTFYFTMFSSYLCCSKFFKLMIFSLLIILKNIVTSIIDEHKGFTEKTSVDHR